MGPNFKILFKIAQRDKGRVVNWHTIRTPGKQKNEDETFIRRIGKDTNGKRVIVKVRPEVRIKRTRKRYKESKDVVRKKFE